MMIKAYQHLHLVCLNMYVNSSTFMHSKIFDSFQAWFKFCEHRTGVKQSCVAT